MDTFLGKLVRIFVIFLLIGRSRGLDVNVTYKTNTTEFRNLTTEDKNTMDINLIKQCYVSLAPNETGLGIFYGAIEFTIDLIQPNYLYEIENKNDNNNKTYGNIEESFNSYSQHWAWYFMGYIIILSLICFFLICIPTSGLCVVCFRCRGKCGGKSSIMDKKNTKCTRACCTIYLVLLTSLIFVGILFLLVLNNQIYSRLDKDNGIFSEVKQSVGGVKNWLQNKNDFPTMLNGTIGEIKEYVMNMSSYMPLSIQGLIEQNVNDSYLDQHLDKIHFIYNEDALQFVHVIENTDELSKNIWLYLKICDTLQCNNSALLLSEIDAFISDLRVYLDNNANIILDQILRDQTDIIKYDINAEIDIFKNETSLKMHDILYSVQLYLSNMFEHISERSNNDAILIKLDEIQEQLQSTAVAVHDVRSTIYFVFLGLLLPLCLILVLLYLGMIFGSFCPRPKSGNKWCSLNRKMGTRSLKLALILIYFHCWIYLIITSALFLVGGITQSELCRHLVHPERISSRRVLQTYGDMMKNYLNITNDENLKLLFDINTYSECQSDNQIGFLENKYKHILDNFSVTDFNFNTSHLQGDHDLELKLGSRFDYLFSSFNQFEFNLTQILDSYNDQQYGFSTLPSNQHVSNVNISASTESNSYHNSVYTTGAQSAIFDNAVTSMTEQVTSYVHGTTDDSEVFTSDTVLTDKTTDNSTSATTTSVDLISYESDNMTGELEKSENTLEPYEVLNKTTALLYAMTQSNLAQEFATSVPDIHNNYKSLSYDISTKQSKSFSSSNEYTSIGTITNDTLSTETFLGTTAVFKNTNNDEPIPMNKVTVDSDSLADKYIADNRNDSIESTTATVNEKQLLTDVVITPTIGVSVESLRASSQATPRDYNVKPQNVMDISTAKIIDQTTQHSFMDSSTANSKSQTKQHSIMDISTANMKDQTTGHYFMDTVPETHYLKTVDDVSSVLSDIENVATLGMQDTVTEFVIENSSREIIKQRKRRELREGVTNSAVTSGDNGEYTSTKHIDESSFMRAQPEYFENLRQLYSHMNSLKSILSLNDTFTRDKITFNINNEYLEKSINGIVHNAVEQTKQKTRVMFKSLFTKLSERIGNTLSRTYRFAVNATCVNTLGPINEIWFVLGWCLLLLLPCTIISFVLMDLYRIQFSFMDGVDLDVDEHRNGAYDAYGGPDYWTYHTSPISDLQLRSLERGPSKDNSPLEEDAVINNMFDNPMYAHEDEYKQQSPRPFMIPIPYYPTNSKRKTPIAVKSPSPPPSYTESAPDNDNESDVALYHPYLETETIDTRL